MVLSDPLGLFLFDSSGAPDLVQEEEMAVSPQFQRGPL